MQYTKNETKGELISYIHIWSPHGKCMTYRVCKDTLMARHFLEDFNDYKDFAFLKLAGTNS